MKRLNLFEFEDHPSFPTWLRDAMTRYIQVFHRVMKTPPSVAELVERALAFVPEKRVIDLCSGAGGPMLDVIGLLRGRDGLSDVELCLTDLYPNQAAADQVAALGDPKIRYERESVDATQVGSRSGVRTLIGSFHHLPVDAARAVLLDAARSRQPLVVFELSDNGAPIFLWWAAIPVAFAMVPILTPLIRPLSLRQLVFTYVIPLIPLFVAWDGAASNARTYTPDDVRELLAGHKTEGYRFEIGSHRVGRLPGKCSYVIGFPVENRAD